MGNSQSSPRSSSSILSFEMGGDGGSIAGRHDLVNIRGSVMGNQTGRYKSFDHNSMRQSSDLVESDPLEARLDRAENCALSQLPLAAPVVCCSLGMLYNKEPLLHALITKEVPEGFQHITSFKDVFSVVLHTNPEHVENTVQTDQCNVSCPRFACSVTNQPMNGTYKFVAIKSTEAVVTAKALKEVAADGTCPVTGKPFDKADVVHLYPDKEEKDELRKEIMRVKAQSKGKSKKRKKDKAEGANEALARRMKVDTQKIAEMKGKEAKSEVWKSLFSKPKKAGEYEKPEDLLTKASGSRSSRMSGV